MYTTLLRNLYLVRIMGRICTNVNYLEHGSHWYVVHNMCKVWEDRSSCFVLLNMGHLGFTLIHKYLYFSDESSHTFTFETI